MRREEAWTPSRILFTLINGSVVVSEALPIFMGAWINQRLGIFSTGIPTGRLYDN